MLTRLTIKKKLATIDDWISYQPNAKCPPLLLPPNRFNQFVCQQNIYVAEIFLFEIGFKCLHSEYLWPIISLY